MKPVELPLHADLPPMAIMWTVDELVPLIALVGFGMIMHAVFKAFLVGLALTVAFRRFKNRHPDGYLYHALYWYGIAPLKGRAILNPFVRRILP